MLLNRLLMAAVFCGLMHAQTNANKASIGGFVSNGAGVAVTSASIHVVNEATGLERETRSNTDGLYLLEALDPGVYEVRVESSGVSTSVKKIAVNVGGTMRVNVSLALDENA